MQQDKDLTEEDRNKINPTKSSSISNALNFIRNPYKCCEKVLELINKLVDLILERREGKSPLYHGESWNLMARRWGKLQKDFQSKGHFDISKIPDIYDCIKVLILFRCSVERVVLWLYTSCNLFLVRHSAQSSCYRI